VQHHGLLGQHGVAGDEVVDRVLVRLPWLRARACWRKLRARSPFRKMPLPDILSTIS
jgi:hypothetical protein